MKSLWTYAACLTLLPLGGCANPERMREAGTLAIAAPALQRMQIANLETAADLIEVSKRSACMPRQDGGRIAALYNSEMNGRPGDFVFTAASDAQGATSYIYWEFPPQNLEEGSADLPPLKQAPIMRRSDETDAQQSPERLVQGTANAQRALQTICAPRNG